MYGWELNPDYGERGFEKSKFAKEVNPMYDKVMSELVYDVFCVLHSLDWYLSGDNGEEQYREDVRTFKEKWLGKTQEEILRREIEDATIAFSRQLKKDFGLDETST